MVAEGAMIALLEELGKPSKPREEQGTRATRRQELIAAAGKVQAGPSPAILAVWTKTEAGER